MYHYYQECSCTGLLSVLEVYYSDGMAEKLEEIVNCLQDMVKDVAIFEYDKVVKAA